MGDVDKFNAWLQLKQDYASAHSAYMEHKHKQKGAKK